jgi:hypothetical protein
MRLYSLTDMTNFVHQLLIEKGFVIIAHEGRGVIEATQRSGVFSQTFRIKVEVPEERDPL